MIWIFEDSTRGITSPYPCLIWCYAKAFYGEVEGRGERPPWVRDAHKSSSTTAHTTTPRRDTTRKVANSELSHDGNIRLSLAGKSAGQSMLEWWENGKKVIPAKASCRPAVAHLCTLHSSPASGRSKLISHIPIQTLWILNYVTETWRGNHTEMLRWG